LRREIGRNLVVPGGVEEIQAQGMYVLPGGIDPHTHLNFYFMGTRTVDDFYDGTRAAVAGGTTTLIDFVAPAPIDPEHPERGNINDLVQSFERHKRVADEQAVCDFAFHVVVPRWEASKTAAQMAELVERGVNSFKVFMAYKGDLMLRDDEILAVFAECRRVGALAMVHAENGDVIEHRSNALIQQGVTGPEGHLQSRPESVEGEATGRAILLASEAKCPLYVVHVMSRAAAQQMLLAKTAMLSAATHCAPVDGQASAVATGTPISPVWGETLGAALGADGCAYFHQCWRHAAGHVLSPPLRNDKTTGDYLATQLAAGILDLLGSDHCTFGSSQKAIGRNDFRKIPNGVNGVEERLMVAFERTVQRGKLDLCRFVAISSSNAARLFNLYPRKGRIAVGSDADIAIWARRERVLSAATHQSRVDFNIFEGMKVQHQPVVVISQGRVVVRDGQLQVIRGVGRFLPTAPNCPYVYSRLNRLEQYWTPVKVDRSRISETKAPIEVEVPKRPITAASNASNISGSSEGDLLEKCAQSQLAEKLQQLTCDTDSVHDFSSGGPPSPNGSIISSVSNASSDGFHRIRTRSGVKNLQDSTFKLTGEQIDDNRRGRTNIKVHNPPGGRSAGLW
jgi:dihydropyrimidinase